MTEISPPIYQAHQIADGRSLASQINEEKITSYFECLTLCSSDAHTCKTMCREVLTTM